MTVVDERSCVTRFSRHAGRFLRRPPISAEPAIVEWLLSLAECEDLSGAVLFPSCDQGVSVLARHREVLCQHCKVTPPPWNVTRFAYDKRLTCQLAERQGVPTPETYFGNSMNGLASLSVEFPVVVKPAIQANFFTHTKGKAYRASGGRELMDHAEQMAAIIPPSEILVQELVAGGAANLYSYFGYFVGGEPFAGFSARRTRQHPMDFGRASTFVQTAYIPELEKLATQFLQAVEYTGLAEVEFMWNPKHAHFELLEINPRYGARILWPLVPEWTSFI